MNGAATGSVVQQFEITMPLDCSWGRAEAISARSAAVVTIASTPCRAAVWYAARTLVGVPVVAIVEDDHPSSEAALATILPCRSHTAMPQLMKSIFLPAGIALPTGVVTVTVVGRCMAWATS